MYMYNLVRASVVIDVCSTHFSKMWMHECTGTSQGCGCTNVQALLRGVMHECTGTSQGCGCTNVQALLKGTNVQALLKGTNVQGGVTVTMDHGLLCAGLRYVRG